MPSVTWNTLSSYSRLLCSHWPAGFSCQTKWRALGQTLSSCWRCLFVVSYLSPHWASTTLLQRCFVVSRVHCRQSTTTITTTMLGRQGGEIWSDWLRRDLRSPFAAHLPLHCSHTPKPQHPIFLLWCWNSQCMSKSVSSTGSSTYILKLLRVFSFFKQNCKKFTYKKRMDFCQITLTNICTLLLPQMTRPPSASNSVVAF